MSKNLFALLLLLTLSLSAYAQIYSPFYLKRLKDELNVSHKDSTRAKLFYELGDYYLIIAEPSKEKGHFDTAFKYFQKALVLSEQVPVRKEYGWPNILCKLGDIFYLQADYKKSIGYYKKVIDFYAAKNDLSNAAGTYGKLATISWRVGRRKESLHYMEMSRDLYAKANNKELEVAAKVEIAVRYINLNGDDSAKVICLKLIADHKNTRYKSIDFAYQGLAIYYRYRGDLNKALFYIFESNNWMVKTGDTMRNHSIFGEFAQIYQDLGQTDKSIAYYKKTIQIRKMRPLRQDFVYRTAGFLIQQLIKKQQPGEGLKYIEALERDYVPVGDSGKASIAQAKAYCYEALKQYDLAENCYKEVVDFYVHDNPELYDIAVFDISKFYVGRKQYMKAAGYLSKALLDTAYVRRTKDIQLLLYKIDSAKGDYRPALQHLLRFQVLNDSIFNSTKSRQIEELNIKYETGQKEKDISVLKKDSLLQHERVKQADKIRNLTLSGAVILLLFILLLYYSYRFNKRNSVEISKKNEALNQLIIEKEWLLKEIHHRVKNNLQIVMGLLQRQSAYIDNDAALAAIQNSENRMRSIALIHQKLYQSENLDLIFMPEYIDEMISYLKDSCGLDNRIFFEKQLDEIYLDVAQAVPLGLILNEAITNAIKYAYKADTPGIIYLSLVKGNDGYIQLTIADNGPGLPAGFNVNKVESLGINLMRGLSKQLDGNFDIVSEQGCMINISFRTGIFKRDNGSRNNINLESHE